MFNLYTAWNKKTGSKSFWPVLIIFVAWEHNVLPSMFLHNTWTMIRKEQVWSWLYRMKHYCFPVCHSLPSCVSYIRCLSYSCHFVCSVHSVNSPWCNCHGYFEQKKCKKVNCTWV
jgi:hypothetical protein